MPGLALPLSPEAVGSHGRRAGFAAAVDQPIAAHPTLTREFYIRRIAIALIICNGKDPKHPTRKISVTVDDGAKISTTKTVVVFCQCRVCRAWICVRNTPRDELKEAACLAEELKTHDFINDLILL